MPADARGCWGIGRARKRAQGAPWRLAEIAHALYGAPLPEIPEGAALTDLVREHYDRMIDFYGPELGVRCARKHLGWYMDAAGTDAAMRRKVLTERDPSRVGALLKPALEEALEEAA